MKPSILSKYYWIFKLDLKQRVNYLLDYALSALFIVIILFVFTNLWQVIFAGKSTIEGLSIAQLVWYLVLTEAITMGCGWNSMFENVSDEIKSGAIVNYLTKPLSYIGWYFSTTFSRFFNYTGTVFVLGALVTYFLVGPIQFSITTIAPLILIVIISFILSFFVGMAFVSLAFWLEDVTAFYWILQKVLFIFGGMLVPIEMYPEFIRQYLYYLPVSFITYWPGKYFITGDSGILATTLIGQLIWTTIFFLITTILYKIGTRKLNIHGG